MIHMQCHLVFFFITNKNKKNRIVHLALKALTVRSARLAKTAVIVEYDWVLPNMKEKGKKDMSGKILG